MRRRRALQTFAATTVTATAGCLGGLKGALGMDSGSDLPPVENDDSRFSGDGCPKLEYHADEAVCYHELDADPGVPYVVPSAETVEQTGDAVTFTLANGAEDALTFMPEHWRVLKETGAGWQTVTHGDLDQGKEELRPDERYRWRLGTGRTSPEPPQGGESGTVGVHAATRFAFRVNVTLHDDAATELQCTALFEREESS